MSASPGTEWATASGTETEAVGAELSTRLRRGDLVLVTGEVGAGKTTLIRGACRALGAEGPITSPTFAIGQVYGGRDPAGEPLEIAHLDLYRIDDPEAEEPGLIDEYLEPDRIAFIEWPGTELAELSPAGAVHRIGIEHAGGDSRRISLA